MGLGAEAPALLPDWRGGRSLLRRSVSCAAAQERRRQLSDLGSPAVLFGRLYTGVVKRTRPVANPCGDTLSGSDGGNGGFDDVTHAPTSTSPRQRRRNRKRRADSALRLQDGPTPIGRGERVYAHLALVVVEPVVDDVGQILRHPAGAVRAPAVIPHRLRLRPPL
eukprot:2476797-Pyramimonas_sp.AAC.1